MMRVAKYGPLINNPSSPRDITVIKKILGPSISGNEEEEQSHSDEESVNEQDNNNDMVNDEVPEDNNIDMDDFRGAVAAAFILIYISDAMALLPPTPAW